MVLRIVAIVQACRLRRFYRRRMGQRDQLLLPEVTAQRDALSVQPAAHDHPAYLTLSDVGPGE